MRGVAKVLVLAGSALLLAQVAHAADFPKQKDRLSASEQRGAIVDCKYELGRSGWPLLQATYVEYPWGGKTVMRILPHGNVSTQDAAWINACADDRLGRGQRLATPAQTSHNPCPRHAPVIYGGATYCIRN